MDGKELKQNNVYYFGTIKENVVITEVDTFSSYFKCKSISNTIHLQSNKDFSGAKITQEVLLVCGFSEEEDYYELVINEFLSIIWVGFLGIMINGNIAFLPKNIYIHQLQDLYLSLKGDNLTIF